ncbi:hypothetical protein, partial [Cellvibrio sp.]
MKAQVPAPQEQTQPLVQARLYAKRDARVEVAQAKALQALGDTSPRVRQMRSMQALIQRKVQSPVKNTVPPVANFFAGDTAMQAMPVMQMKWIDDSGGILLWDQLIDGVQWYFNKESGKMFYKIANPEAIKLGSLESYRVYEGQSQAYEFWQANSALDLDIGQYLDASVITPDEAVAKELAPATGMEAQDKGAYLMDAKTLETEWGDKSSEQRAETMLLAVNKSLTQTGAPAITYSFVDLDEDSYGSFSESKWNMELNRALFTKDTVDSETMAQVADTVFHEARHAEQFFRIARLLAGMGFDVGEIQRRMSMKGAPANAGMIAVALSTPMVISEDGLDTEVMETLHWYQSLYGAKANDRIKVILTMKDVKLQFYKLLGQMQVLKSEFMLLRMDIQNAPFESEMEKEEIEEAYQQILLKLKTATELEIKNLTEEKEKLAANLKDIPAKYKQFVAELKQKGKSITAQQHQVEEQMKLTFEEFSRWQELYKNLA